MRKMTGSIDLIGLRNGLGANQGNRILKFESLLILLGSLTHSLLMLIDPLLANMFLPTKTF